MKRLFKQFSFPGGIPSHVSPETPGSINEGGELGYSLAHAYGAAFDNPDLIVACVVGDGEAETGALAASWHSNKFLNPERDGAVLPILHLNGYKIANPTVLARITPEELDQLFRRYGYNPYVVEGSDPAEVHQKLAGTLDTIVAEIKQIQRTARSEGFRTRPRWPMIIFRTPKGWTGPKGVDGLPVEGTWRAHQVPLAELATKPEHLKQLEQWMQSYKPAELFDANGSLAPELAELAPKGNRRMSANPHANGGKLLRDVVTLNADGRNFRVVNVVDLMTLQPQTEHPHGLSDEAFDAIFTRDKPIVFAFHGYPLLIHRLTYRRTNHANLHVRGFKEEGTTTTPFDMTVLNDLDRFHLADDVIDRVPGVAERTAPAKQFLRDKLAEHHRYIRQYGQDMPEIRNWAWHAP